jgi:hypothetical protein
MRANLSLLVGLSLASSLSVADEPPATGKPLSINQIMVRAHLRPQNRATRNHLDHKLIDGKATDAEKQELLDLYTQLTKLTPPKGDAEAFRKDAQSLVDAVQAIIDGKENGKDLLIKATDCKSCHAKYRGQ